MTALDKRKICIERRKSISEGERTKKEKAIMNRVLPFLKGKIGIYIPVNGEVDMYSRLKNHYDLYLPKTIDESHIAFYSDLEQKTYGKFHIFEPIGMNEIKDLDVILVPVVGFRNCARMGYGKGYYDRYLEHSNALKIGVAFDIQEIDFEIKKTDVMLDYMITESRSIRL